MRNGTPRGVFTDWQSRRLRRAEGTGRTGRETHRTRLACTSSSRGFRTCSTHVLVVFFSEGISDRHGHINERHASRSTLPSPRERNVRESGRGNDSRQRGRGPTEGAMFVPATFIINPSSSCKERRGLRGLNRENRPRRAGHRPCDAQCPFLRRRLRRN